VDECKPLAGGGAAVAGGGGAAVVRREILTARKGQRPAEWVDWHEARRTMLGWTEGAFTRPLLSSS